jgi:hypothetical protein
MSVSAQVFGHRQSQNFHTLWRLAWIAQKKFPRRRRDGSDKDAINTGA